MGNLILRRTLWLFKVVVPRGVFVLPENPGSSRAFRLPDFISTKAELGLERAWVWLRPFGHSMDKPVVLHSNATWINAIFEPLKRASRGCGARRQDATSGWKRTANNKWVTAVGTGLKDSAAYPERFVSKVLDVWTWNDLPWMHEERVNQRNHALKANFS